MEMSCLVEEGCVRAHREDMLVKLLHDREARHLRSLRCTVTGLLLVGTVIVAFLLMVGYQLIISGRCQHIPSADDHPSGVSTQQQQQQERNHPSVFLTVLNGTSSEILKWNTVRDRGRLEGGFTYSDGEFVVPRDGYYKLYLQITYAWNPAVPLCAGVHMLILNQSVHVCRHSYPKYLPLMVSYDTVSCSTPSGLKSVFAAAVFYLEAMDRLKVVSTHPQLIHTSWRKDREFGHLFAIDLEPR